MAFVDRILYGHSYWVFGIENNAFKPAWAMRFSSSAPSYLSKQVNLRLLTILAISTTKRGVLWRKMQLAGWWGRRGKSPGLGMASFSQKRASDAPEEEYTGLRITAILRPKPSPAIHLARREIITSLLPMHYKFRDCQVTPIWIHLASRFLL